MTWAILPRVRRRFAREPQRRYREGQPPQNAFEAWRHGADHLCVEAYAGHAGEAALDTVRVCGDAEIYLGDLAVQDTLAGRLPVERQTQLSGQHVRRAERQDAERGPVREPVQDLVHGAVAARGHDQAVPGAGGQLGGVVWVFGV